MGANPTYVQNVHAHACMYTHMCTHTCMFKHDNMDASMGAAICNFYICLTSVTRAKPKEKNKIFRSISTRAVKCDGVFFILQHGFQYGFSTCLT